MRYSVIDKVGHPGIDELDGELGLDGVEMDLLYDGLEELVTCDDEELECDREGDELVEDSSHGVELSDE